MPSETVTIEKFSQSDLLACMPRLHNFARSLTRHRERAEDLVQDTVVRAVTAANRFQAGTNLQAWMFTILRNQHYTNLRRDRIRIRSLDDASIPGIAVAPSQEGSLEFKEFRRAFSELSNEHRDALNHVGVDGLSYAEAAKLCGCPMGTMKSRVSRARQALRRRLDAGVPSHEPQDRLAPFVQMGGVPKGNLVSLSG